VTPPWPHPIIAREGWPFLGIALAVSVLLFFLVGAWWSVPFWLATVFILQFFRDPPREAPTTRRRCSRRPTAASSR
jgi:phosphatidylserine decarboxylase